MLDWLSPIFAETVDGAKMSAALTNIVPVDFVVRPQSLTGNNECPGLIVPKRGVASRLADRLGPMIATLAA
jgi:hypothetical protein